VARRGLVTRLTQADTPIAVIAAPAGYGKTALLAQWDSRDARPFAWLTVGKEHDDGASLLAAIEEALDDVAPLERHGRGSSTRSRRSSTAVALARVARSLAARPPFVLVLDDLHVLGDSGSLETVRTLARHVPAGCALALSSRTVPALPVGRLRANRELTEILPQDLVMTTREAAALLELSGLKLSHLHAETVAKKAEGWPAGIYLAALAIRDQSDVPAAVARFGGDDPIVSEYLRDEVLSGVSQEAISFLMHTSMLDRLSGPVCDEVLGRSDSAQVLSDIGRTDLLLVPLDRRDESYRCHGLLAGMLRAGLRRTDPAAEARLHGRASDWHAGRGEVDRAMHHAAAAGDSIRAAALLAGNAPEYVTRYGNSRMEGWLSSFTEEQIAAQPALALAAANSHLLKGELYAVQGWESAARRVLKEKPPAERRPALEATVAILNAAAAREGLARMGKDAARGYELEPEDSPWRALCCLLEGVSRQLAGDGDGDGAEARLLEGVRRGAVAAPNVQTLCLAQLALAGAGRDDWEGAAEFASRARAQVEHYGLAEYPSSALVFAVSAAVRARRGRVDEAQADMRTALGLLERLTDFMPWYEAETQIALADAALRLSDMSRARELVASAERIARAMPEAVALRAWIAPLADAATKGSELLTTAELRILKFLPTHLSFREIAGRLFVSANTVKTQAHAVYRKLDAASRSEAVTRATQLGLLDF
jgi:LuxR family maltose regulon positive regulatory protein